ncbi:MAG: ATP-binding protein [Verrucomicrobiota bacterium]
MTEKSHPAERFPRELEILRRLADALPHIVWIARPDGYHQYYNRHWYEYTGLPSKEAGAEAWNTLLHPEDLERANERWAEALRTGEPYDIEYRFKRASDGAYRWFLGRALPYRDSDGQIVNWFGTATDIHEQKLTEHALRKARDEMTKENRQKDQFLGMVSHELRTPLNAIFGWTRLLQHNLLSEEERVEAAAAIMRNAEAQAHLIEDVLDITRIINQKLHLDRHVRDLAEIVAQAVDAVRPSAVAGGLELSTTTDANDLLVNVDAMRLQQVILNLLTNAVKFTPRGGRITVRVSRQHAFAAVEIADTGKGISADLLPHIFERFRQGDSSSTRQHGGLGLGLAIAHQLVAMHDGRIEVQSEGANKGTRFMVLLPIVAVDTREQAAPRSQPDKTDLLAAHTLRGLHVLVVDDEASVRDLMAITLSKCGASVTVASAVRDALDAMRERKPDVIVSDIAMPEVDGYEFIRMIRGLGSGEGTEIPVIALTAYASLQDQTRALELGFNQHLSKPVDPIDLVRAIVAAKKTPARDTVQLKGSSNF